MNKLLSRRGAIGASLQPSAPVPPIPPPTGTLISVFDMDNGVNPPNQWTGYAGYTNQARFFITASDSTTGPTVTPRNGGYFARVECRQGESAPWASSLNATIRQQGGLPIGYNKTYPDMYYGWSSWIPSSYPWSNASMHSIFAEIHGAGSMSQAPFHWGILGNGASAGRFFIDLHRATTGYSPLFQPAFQRLSDPGMANRWIDNVLRIKWSQGSDGVLQYWMDGTLMHSYNGPTAPISGENIYPQLGMYKYNANGNVVIYHDEARVGTTREIVDPANY